MSIPNPARIIQEKRDKLFGAVGDFVDTSSLLGVLGASGLDKAAEAFGEVKAALSAAAETNSFTGSQQTAEPRPVGQDQRLPNPLENYASFNCIFELGVLTPYSINNPELTYRQSGSDFTILRSGGGGIDQTRIATVYEAAGKEPGNMEYFIDDVDVSAIVAPSKRSGISQATKIEFTVHEPYSMGLFLQAMQAAAYEANGLNSNYLDAVYMLELDFVGWDDNGNAVPVDQANRKIPLKLINIEFDVERGGSVYKVSAIPWNEQALLDQYQMLGSAVSITGNNIIQALTTGYESFQTIVNEAITMAATSKNEPVSDFYVVRFPSSRTTLNNVSKSSTADTGATLSNEELFGSRSGADLAEENQKNKSKSAFVNLFRNNDGGDNGILQTIRTNTLGDINKIGQSLMISPNSETVESNSDYPFGLGLYAYDEEKKIYARDGVELSLTNGTRKFKFDQNTKLTKVIEEMVLISEYGKNAINQVQNNDQMIEWFRIETQVFVIDDRIVSERLGKKAKVFVYNVVPYEVASSTFIAPNETINYSKLEQQVVKEYDYIYSGENKDVLGFDINFNAAFFTAIRQDMGELGAGSRNATADGMVSPDQVEGINVGDGSAGGTPSEGNTVNRQAQVGMSVGGSYNQSVGQILARTFHNALINSEVDLITANLEIWGDPYYIHDSGLGNYSSPRSTSSINITADKAADYQRNHVHILLNFRSPLDYMRDGNMEFPEDTQIVEGFSGLYRVMTVNSNFSGNQFKQTLSLIREKGQSTEGATDNAKLAQQRDSNSVNQNPETNKTLAEITGIESTTAATGAINPTVPLTEGGALEFVTSNNDPAVRAQVAELVRENFQALVDELENDLGYDIRSLQGFNRRAARGSQNWSYHASGLAMDINPDENLMAGPPRPADAPEPTDMPMNGTGSAMEALAAKHGLGWGGAWERVTDAMHFSAALSENGTLDYPRNGVIPGTPAPTPQSATGETEEVPTVDTTDDARAGRTNAVSGTSQVSGGRGNGAAEVAQRRADAATTTTSSTSNSQGAVTGLRPYRPIDPQDDRYNFNTGDKIKAILAAKRNQE